MCGKGGRAWLSVRGFEYRAEELGFSVPPPRVPWHAKSSPLFGALPGVVHEAHGRP